MRTVGVPGARRVSPFLLFLVILTFFLVFAGVSCNTTAAKSAVQSLGGSAGLTEEGAKAHASLEDVISADPVARSARTIGTEQHNALRTLLVHAEHEHLAAHRTDLPRGQIDHRDDGAPGELLGRVVIGQPPRGSPGSERAEVDEHPVRGLSRLGKRLTAHHDADADVDGEELRGVDLGRRSTLSAHAWQCIGTPILARDT